MKRTNLQTFKHSPKRILSLLLVLAMLCTALPRLSVPASADNYSGTCGDNLTWSFDPYTGLLTIEGSGAMNSAPWEKFKTQITQLSLPAGLTSIYMTAFRDCTRLSAVSLPEGLASIGRSAFSGCTGLISIYLPESLTSMNDDAFSGCTGLVEFQVAPGNTVFSNDECGVLFNKDKTRIIQYPKARVGAYEIPEGVTEIGYSFSNCPGLSSVTIPGTVESIYFKGCSALSEVTIKNGVSIVEREAFENCEQLSSIDFPESVTEIRDLTLDCYSSNSKLRSITVRNPDCVLGQFISHNILPGDVVLSGYRGSTLDYYNRSKNGSPAGWFTFASLGDVDHEVVIDRGAWKLNLTTGVLEFPEGEIYDYYRSYGDYFSVTPMLDYRPWQLYSFAIRTVSLPEGLERIPSYSFTRCEELYSIELPESVSSIGASAFYQCSNLAAITVRNPDCTFEGPIQPTSSYEKCATLFGYADSTASAYAAEQGLPFRNIETGTFSGEGENGLHWELDVASGLLQVNGSWQLRNAPWDELRGKIKTAVLSEGITSISKNVFTGYKNLTSLSLPESLSKLEKEAFADCSGLTDVVLPDALSATEEEAFVRCYRLRSIELPAALTALSLREFKNCIALEQVTFKNGLTSIGEYAFENCFSLKTPDLPEQLQSIGSYAFQKCESLETISFPEQLQSIGYNAFGGCVSLRTISFPDGHLSIDDGAFGGCRSLTSVTLPRNLASVGFGAFSGCTGLREVTVLNPACELEAYAFPNRYVEFIIRGYRYSSADIYARKYNVPFESIGDLEEVEGVCGPNAFWRYIVAEGRLIITGTGAMTETPWRNLEMPITELELPEGLTSVYKAAFRDSEITQVSLPETLSSIGENAFRNCAELTELTLPASLNELGAFAFTGCEALRKMVFLGNKAYIETMRGSVIPELNDTPEDLTLTEAGKNMLGPHSRVMIYGPAVGVNGDKIFEIAEGYRDVYEDGEEPIFWMSPKFYAERFGYSFFPTDSFGDVKPTAYYAVPVAWALANGITTGTGEGTFSPKMTCTRAQIVTFLYNAAGKPGHHQTASPFTDVKPGKWYYDAVMWAYENEITGGVGDGLFGVNQGCTRGQAMTFLWKSLGSPEPERLDNPFTDVTPGKYYFKAVLWALENGITTGTGPSTFGTQDTCTRAQIVTFLYKAYAE